MNHKIHLHCCPVPGCTTVIPIHFAMCRTHWQRVGFELRTELIGALNRHRDGVLSAGDLARVQARANAEALQCRAAKGGAA